MNDKDYLRLVLELENATDDLLEALVIDFENYIQSHSNDPTAAQAIAELLLAKFAVDFTNLMVESIGKMAQLATVKERANIMPLLTGAGAFNEASIMDAMFDTYAERVQRRFPRLPNVVDGKTFSQRIKTIQTGATMTVRNIIDNAVKEGKGAQEIARQIRNYIKPTLAQTSTRPWDVYRERFSRPTNYRPRNVAAGTIRYNAIRIARTEATRMWDTATYDFYEGKPYVEGYEWLLSNRHPAYDDCDIHAANSPYKRQSQVPYKHPQCLCRVVAKIASEERISQLVRQGVLL